MPLPAHPTPGVGPPASTHMTPQAPFTAISSSVKLFPFSRIRSSTVFILLSAETPPRRAKVESALGSQPICITVYPSLARATATFDTVVDLPMPPFPYIAIFFICTALPFLFFAGNIEWYDIFYGLAVYLHLIYDGSDTEYFFYIFRIDYLCSISEYRLLSA